MAVEPTEITLGEIMRRYRKELDASGPLSDEQRKVINAICRCRTHEMGNHDYECEDCGEIVPMDNSCRNRHCPQCQGISQKIWVKKQVDNLLPVNYFHTILTIPDSFNQLVFYNQCLIYSLLFLSMWSAVQKAFKEKFCGTPGVIAVLHTWGQQLCLHPHLHCLITGGALSEDEMQWRKASAIYLVDVTKLSEYFRDSFCRRLLRAYRRGDIVFTEATAHLADETAFTAFVAEQQAKSWNVRCEKPFAGPQQVLNYIGRYTHRVGIANSRILDLTDGVVTFAYKDYQDEDENGEPKHKTRKLPAVKFLRRFLLHVLPPRFRKIRHYGILAGDMVQEKLEHCRELLYKEVAELMKEPPFIFQRDPVCPCCGGRMVRRPKIPGPEAPPGDPFDHAA